MLEWILVIFFGLVLTSVVSVALVYNRLVTLRNRFTNAWSQIDVQLKRRYDLIPNLVETAQAYMRHERETLEAVTQARGAAHAARTRVELNPGAADVVMGLVAAETALVGAMGRFLGVVEGYPDLKADRTMRNLMEELTSTENRIAFARQCYNDAVMTYNTARESFPGVLMAGSMGFEQAPYFRIDDDAERRAVRVVLT